MDLWATRAHANGIGRERARTVVDAVANGEVVRTWAMRGTLHMVASADLRWVVRAVGPYFRDRQAPRRRQLGLDDAACERGAAQLEDILTAPLTREEIRARVELDLAGQAAPYLLSFAALEGLICRGPERGSEPTYVLVWDWVTGDADDDLVLRYLAGHQPPGLPISPPGPGCRSPSLGRASRTCGTSSSPRVTAASCSRGDVPRKAADVRLLGHFDAFLLGYRERSIPAEHTRKVQSGGGFVMPVVSVGGHVVGTWRQQSRGDGLTVGVTPFTTVSAQVRSGLSSEAADLGRFLGTTTSLSVTDIAPTD